VSTEAEFVYRRVLNAPRELVWRCLTEPDHLTQFWAPAGMTTPRDGIVVEPWPGGRFETLMVGDRGSYRMVATFTDVEPPLRIGWVDSTNGVHTLSTLDDVGDGRTSLFIRQWNVPTAMQTEEARSGFLSSLDKLETHLSALSEGDCRD